MATAFVADRGSNQGGFVQVPLPTRNSTPSQSFSQHAIPAPGVGPVAPRDAATTMTTVSHHRER